MPGHFEFPHRWTEIAPLLLFDDDENPAAKTAKINQATSYLDDRDRALEDRLNLANSIRARVYRNAAWNTTNGNAVVVYDTFQSGTAGLFDLSSGAFLCPVPGDYLVEGAFHYTSGVLGGYSWTEIRKNAVLYARNGAYYTGGANWSPSADPLTAVVYDCVAGDLLATYQQCSEAVAGVPGPANTWMQVRLLT